jgi:hypothetical protein
MDMAVVSVSGPPIRTGERTPSTMMSCFSNRLFIQQIVLSGPASADEFAAS